MGKYRLILYYKIIEKRRRSEMSKTKFVVLTTIALLLAAMLLLGACTREVQVPIEKTVVQTQTVPVEKTTVVEKTVEKTVVPALPSIIRMVTVSGGSKYTSAVAMADALSKQLGVKVIVEGFGTNLEELAALRAGEGNIWMTSTTTLYDPAYGLSDFNKPEWGPQPVRVMFVGQANYFGLMTTKKTGIKTYDDVKGRSVAFLPGSQIVNESIESCLKAHGLSYDDMKKVDFGSYAASLDGLQDGIVDLVLGSFPSAKVLEIDSTVGVVVLPFSKSAETAKIWQGLRPAHPLLPAPTGAFPGANGNILIPGSSLYVGAYDHLNEDLAYRITKGIYECVDVFNKVAAASGWKKELGYQLPVVAPFHPGSIRFFKEIGQWTAEHEKFQQEALRAEEARIAQWKAAAK